MPTMNTAVSRTRVARTIVVAAAVCGAALIVLFLEFDSWFYNNELAAYIRWGLLAQDQATLQAFYDAAREACRRQQPTVVQACEDYQIGLLTNGPLARPLATTAGVALAALAPIAGFMASLKWSIVWLGIGGALIVSLLTTPFLLRLPPRGLAAVAGAWIGGWGATRLLQPDVIGAALPAMLAIGLLAAVVCAAASVRFGVALRTVVSAADSGVGTKLKWLYQVLGIVACFAIAYGVHRLFRSSYPTFHLLLGLGLWPLLWRAVPALGVRTSGLLAGAVCTAAASIPFSAMVYLPKGQQVVLLGVMIGVAIFRDDARVFRALPLLLLFDMQLAVHLCALIIVAEGLTAFFRGKGFAALIPPALTAAAAALVMLFTTVYPQKDNLFDLGVAAAILASPAVITSAVAGIALIWNAADRSRAAPTLVALDRLLIYAAAIVVMAGFAIVAYGQPFYAFRLGTMFREMAPAPSLAVIAGTASLLLGSRRESTDVAVRGCMVAALATVLLLMTSIKGPSMGVTQFAEGVRASVSRYTPPRWERWPQMSFDDDVVYLDAGNPTSSPLMQYSLIKALLLAKAGELKERKPAIAVFGRPR
jgi:hypothetical protein